MSKLKTPLRHAGERTRDALWRRIGAILDQFTPDECANYLRAAGYGADEVTAFAGVVQARIAALNQL